MAIFISDYHLAHWVPLAERRGGCYRPGTPNALFYFGDAMKRERTLPVEEWRWVVGYKGLYEVSNHGRVRSYHVKGPNKNNRQCPNPKLISLKPNDYGYVEITLRHKYGNPKDDKQVKVHRLVLEAFVGSCPDGMDGSHQNGKRNDNLITNLLWETPKENNDRKKQHGTYQIGDKNGFFGKKHTKETKIKMSIAKRKHHESRCYTHGGFALT